MKCLACGAEMRLIDVRPDRTTVCGIERHTFRCSACTHTAQRLVLNRPRVPITNLPVVIPPKAPVIDPHKGRPAAQSAWAKSIEKVNNKQAELKQREAATTEWVRSSRSSASASNSKQWQREPRHWQGRLRSCAAYTRGSL